MDRFQNKVFRLALSMVHDETSAQDLTQDILLRIWKGLPGYHGEASLSTWIYTISRNACLTELRRQAARPTVSLAELEGDLDNAEDGVSTLHTTDQPAGIGLDVDTLLARLPDTYRQVITLFYLEQKSYDEVAAMLGIPLGTVKTFLYRAKKELLKLSGRTEHVYV